MNDNDYGTSEGRRLVGIWMSEQAIRQGKADTRFIRQYIQEAGQPAEDWLKLIQLTEACLSANPPRPFPGIASFLKKQRDGDKKVVEKSEPEPESYDDGYDGVGMFDDTDEDVLLGLPGHPGGHDEKSSGASAKGSRRSSPLHRRSSPLHRRSRSLHRRSRSGSSGPGRSQRHARRALGHASRRLRRSGHDG